MTSSTRKTNYAHARLHARLHAHAHAQFQN